MSRSVSGLLVLAIPLGCTSVLGIDGDYVLDTREAGLVAAGGSTTGGNMNETGGAESGGTSGSGGSATGGRSGMIGNGGIVATGGMKATGGIGASGGSSSCDADGASCPSGQKCCPAPQQPGATAFCADPAPLVGCDARDCAPCDAPPDNGVAVCSAGQCDFQCNANFTRKGSVCEADGAGGGGGAGGSPGTGGAPTCVRTNCPGCGFAGPFGCCKSNGTCGCIPYVGPCL